MGARLIDSSSLNSQLHLYGTIEAIILAFQGGLERTGKICWHNVLDFHGFWISIATAVKLKCMRNECMGMICCKRKYMGNDLLQAEVYQERVHRSDLLQAEALRERLLQKRELRKWVLHIGNGPGCRTLNRVMAAENGLHISTLGSRSCACNPERNGQEKNPDKFFSSTEGWGMPYRQVPYEWT